MASPHIQFHYFFDCISSTPFLAHFASAILASMLFSEYPRNSLGLGTLHLLFFLLGTLKFSWLFYLLNFHHFLVFPHLLPCSISLLSAYYILVTDIIYSFCSMAVFPHLEYKLQGGQGLLSVLLTMLYLQCLEQCLTYKALNKYLLKEWRN